MDEGRINWIKIAASEAELHFGPNEILELMAGDRKICIGRFQNELYAFSNKCPHASGLFADGYIDATGNVVCPIHRYKFCMRNGRNVTGEGYFLKHWKVETRPDGIYVGIEKNKFFDIF